MASRITAEQSARIDAFVAGLRGRARRIATEYVGMPNTPDCQPQALALHFRYGDELRRVSDMVEGLRQELGLHYDALQPELKSRIYHGMSRK